MAFFNPQHHPLVPRSVIDESQSSRLSELLSESASSFAVLSPHTGSAAACSEVEWIVFSPRMSSAAGYTEDSVASIHLADEEEPDITSEALAAGAQTPLAFPSHNGTGSFISPSPVDIAERVNAWRIDQSRFVLQELQRLFGDVQPEHLQTQQQYYEEHISSAEKPRSFWESIRKRVLEDFVGMNDQVMELLFGQVDWAEEEEQQQQQQQQLDNDNDHDSSNLSNSIATHEEHYNNALKYGPPGWDAKLVSNILSELNMPPATSEMSLLKIITSSLVAQYNKRRKAQMDQEARTAVPSPAHSAYWNEGSYSSSNYWETGSINSTRVW